MIDMFGDPLGCW